MQCAAQALLTALLAAVALCCTAAPPLADSGAFIKGADVSFVPALDAAGVKFSANGQPRELLQIYREAGFNLARVRLWVGPSPKNPGGASSLPEVIALAQRIRASGLRFMLDFHYSDWWADPKNQTTPAAWAELPLPALAEQVQRYTRDCLIALDKAGARPQLIQLGNETGGGFLWPLGQLKGDAASWARFGQLMRAARAGVDEAYGADAGVRIVLHVENGADTRFVEHFFDGVAREQIRYDVIGLSYYTFWGGAAAFDTLPRLLEGFASRYRKPVLLVETSYPWTLDWRGSAHNAVGTREGLLKRFPPTPQGQADYLAALTRQLESAATPGEKGWIYWAPDWVATPDSLQSNWENMTLFDFNNHALPGLFVQPGGAPVRAP